MFNLCARNLMIIVPTPSYGAAGVRAFNVGQRN